MSQNGGRSTKRPGILRIILEEVRDVFRRNRRANRLAKARDRLELGDLAPMLELARLSVGEAWLALADYYAAQQPQNPALATQAYHSALQCHDWVERPARAYEEYDRRRFLGIGATQDMQALATEWKSGHLPGNRRETQLAWIHTCGPADLRDPKEAWWWIALAEARWGQCEDVALPSFSAAELREYLVRSVQDEDRLNLHERAKAYAYAEFASGK